MVLAKLYTDRIRAEAYAEGWAEGYAEGYAQGFREGQQRMLTQWRDWNARRKQAVQAGQPFTDPEPGSDPKTATETETADTRK